MSTILHIITGLDNGGAEAVLYRLCIGDKRHCHKVISLTGRGHYGPLLEAAGFTVICLNMPRRRTPIAALLRLWREIRQIKPDVVQTWMYHSNLVGGLIARLAGVRNVIWGIHHTNLNPLQSSLSTVLVAKTCAILSRRIPRQIVCCAESSRDVHIGMGYDAARTRVIPNGYDLSIFKPDPMARAALRCDLGLAQDAPVIGFVARFDPLKDHRTLLKALALLRTRGITPTCLLIGNGVDPENPELTAWISETVPGNQIRLLGQRSDVPAVMNALDIHVMSSSSEAFPNVLAEAMACGTPCVSTDVGDAATIIGTTGRIVPPSDAAALAKAIAEMLDARAARDWPARRAASRAHINKNFALASMVAAYDRTWSVPASLLSARTNAQ